MVNMGQPPVIVTHTQKNVVLHDGAIVVDITTDSTFPFVTTDKVFKAASVHISGLMNKTPRSPQDSDPAGLNRPRSDHRVKVYLDLAPADFLQQQGVASEEAAEHYALQCSSAR
jgi:hypothetical protein